LVIDKYENFIGARKVILDEIENYKGNSSGDRKN
jgi:hypothetical protein